MPRPRLYKHPVTMTLYWDKRTSAALKRLAEGARTSASAYLSELIHEKAASRKVELEVPKKEIAWMDHEAKKRGLTRDELLRLAGRKLVRDRRASK